MHLRGICLSGFQKLEVIQHELVCLRSIIGQMYRDRHIDGVQWGRKSDHKKDSGDNIRGCIHLRKKKLRFLHLAMRTANFTSWGLMASMAHSAWALKFNVTAVTAHNGSSVFECWQIDSPFVGSTQPGIKGSATLNLGGVTNITYGVLPAGCNEPLHTAPAPQ
ncbi:putative small secreted protein [Seiridium unicorne]|uniref:Small secreted protein n=1 Tax=Seiridium unicorne TaxID=138068 RepID=A0ABR2UT27_9PEZI